jgi:capsular polysaccharide export protein
MILSTTKTIARLPHLDRLDSDFRGAVAGWGRKPSGRRAIVLAKLLRRPFLLLEDGFIRSVERSATTLSLIVDDIGVYYDARKPSRMEQRIAVGLDADGAVRARAIMNAWRAGGISKYNHNPDYEGALPARYVLVVDQTRGDLSITGGQASEASFTTMLDAALSENPDDIILVKVHPDVLSGRKRGHISSEWLRHPRVRVLSEGCHPTRLLREALSVYVVTSLMGFEALLWGKPVRCFGMPFYAGWGVTLDELRRPPRRGETRIEHIVHTAFVDLACYADPRDGSHWQVEQAIAHVAHRRSTLFNTGSARETDLSFTASP